MTVAFATKCWGGDYEEFLKGAFERKLASVPYDFDKTFLMINNGVPRAALDALTDIPDIPVIVSDVASEVLSHFGIPRSHLEPGYNYAIGELTTVVYALPYDYLCYVQGDCLCDGGDWVSEGIKVLQSDPNVAVVSPASDVNTWHDPQTKQDHYMSDQAFLVRAGEFQSPGIYDVEGTDPDYPHYGGNSFEAMVGKWLKKTGRTRYILEDYFVYHPQY